MKRKNQNNLVTYVGVASLGYVVGAVSSMAMVHCRKHHIHKMCHIKDFNPTESEQDIINKKNEKKPIYASEAMMQPTFSTEAEELYENTIPRTTDAFEEASMLDMEPEE